LAVTIASCMKLSTLMSKNSKRLHLYSSQATVWHQVQPLHGESIYAVQVNLEAFPYTVPLCPVSSLAAQIYGGDSTHPFAMKLGWQALSVHCWVMQNICKVPNY
jgi:hypothetical protein